MKKIMLVVVLAVWVGQALAEDPERYLSRSRLSSGETVVVAEGDYEARSIGSFSVRVYEPAAEADATTFFLAGIIHGRDGSVENVLLENVQGDAAPEIVVIARSAGSGNYVAAYVFSYSDQKLAFIGGREGIAPASPVIDVLREALKSL